MIFWWKHATMYIYSKSKTRKNEFLLCPIAFRRFLWNQSFYVSIHCSIVVNKLPYTDFFQYAQFSLLLSFRSNRPLKVYLCTQKRLHDVRKAIEVAKRRRPHFNGNANPRNEHARALLRHVAREQRDHLEHAQAVGPMRCICKQKVHATEWKKLNEWNKWKTNQ